ncbi:hypothetical protein ZEAMMB73_Zm00001d053803 [Zea mays]|uniref:Uncharacterized protein n=1 Tax=Zea mays TaxID=4577 RepID=A0A1D6QSD4_MAIZE|nr:hypothetical protein ZEAMMB73_Zm00001d053803 [Zea mays]
MNMPAACCWSMVHVCPPPILEIYPPPMQTEYSLQPAFQGQRSFAFEREGQPMDDVRKIERSLHIGAGQVKLPIPPEKKLMPPGKVADIERSSLILCGKAFADSAIVKDAITAMIAPILSARGGLPVPGWILSFGGSIVLLFAPVENHDVLRRNPYCSIVH